MASGNHTVRSRDPRAANDWRMLLTTPSANLCREVYMRITGEEERQPADSREAYRTHRLVTRATRTVAGCLSATGFAICIGLIGLMPNRGDAGAVALRRRIRSPPQAYRRRGNISPTAKTWIEEAPINRADGRGDGRGAGADAEHAAPFAQAVLAGDGSRRLRGRKSRRTSGAEPSCGKGSGPDRRHHQARALRGAGDDNL